MITVTLPDASRREYEAGVTVADVAQSIGAGLAKAALCGKVDGKLVDLSYKLEKDAFAPLDRPPHGAGCQRTVSDGGSDDRTRH